MSRSPDGQDPCIVCGEAMMGGRCVKGACDVNPQPRRMALGPSGLGVERCLGCGDLLGPSPDSPNLLLCRNGKCSDVSISIASSATMTREASASPQLKAANPPLSVEEGKVGQRRSRRLRKRRETETHREADGVAEKRQMRARSLSSSSSPLSDDSGSISPAQTLKAPPPQPAPLSSGDDKSNRYPCSLTPKCKGRLEIGGTVDEQPLFYRCSECGKAKSSRSAHRVAREHLPTGAAQLHSLNACHRCGASLATEAQRLEHTQAGCPHRCPRCRETFASRWELARHEYACGRSALLPTIR